MTLRGFRDRLRRRSGPSPRVADPAPTDDAQDQRPERIARAGVAHFAGPT
jgi:hypothetical protein